MKKFLLLSMLIPSVIYSTMLEIKLEHNDTFITHQKIVCENESCISATDVSGNKFIIKLLIKENTDTGVTIKSEISEEIEGTPILLCKPEIVAIYDQEASLFISSEKESLRFTLKARP